MWRDVVGMAKHFGTEPLCIDVVAADNEERNAKHMYKDDGLTPVTYLDRWFICHHLVLFTFATCSLLAVASGMHTRSIKCSAVGGRLRQEWISTSLCE